MPICLCIRVCVCMRLKMSVYVCIYVYVYVCVWMRVCVYMFYLQAFVSTSVYIYMCICVQQFHFNGHLQALFGWNQLPVSQIELCSSINVPFCIWFFTNPYPSFFSKQIYLSIFSNGQYNTENNTHTYIHIHTCTHKSLELNIYQGYTMAEGKAPSVSTPRILGLNTGGGFFSSGF